MADEHEDEYWFDELDDGLDDDLDDDEDELDDVDDEDDEEDDSPKRGGAKKTRAKGDSDASDKDVQPARRRGKTAGGGRARPSRVAADSRAEDEDPEGDEDPRGDEDDGDEAEGKRPRKKKVARGRGGAAKKTPQAKRGKRKKHKRGDDDDDLPEEVESVEESDSEPPVVEAPEPEPEPEPEPLEPDHQDAVAALRDLGARLDTTSDDHVYRIFFYDQHGDGDLDQIHGLPGLKELWILGTKVSKAGAEKIREKLPKVKVYYG